MLAMTQVRGTGTVYLAESDYQIKLYTMLFETLLTARLAFIPSFIRSFTHPSIHPFIEVFRGQLGPTDLEVCGTS